jgi:hypothetical protein
LLDNPFPRFSMNDVAHVERSATLIAPHVFPAATPPLEADTRSDPGIGQCTTA